MQIVINVDNKLYEYFSKRKSMHDDGYFSHVGKLIKALRDGTLLPKGHGRLIDADALKSECYSIVDPKGIYSELKIIEDYYIDDASTIIEADKEND